MIRDKKTGYQRNLNYDELVAREAREEASLPVSAHLQRSATAFVLSPFYSRLYEMEHQEQTAPVAPVHIEMPHQYLEALRQAPVQAPAAPGPPGPAGPMGPVGMQGPQGPPGASPPPAAPQQPAINHTYNMQQEVDKVRLQAELDKVQMESKHHADRAAMAEQLAQTLAQQQRQQPLHHVNAVHKPPPPPPAPPAAPAALAAPPGPSAAEIKQAMQEMAQQNGRAIHELAVHTGHSFNQLVQHAKAAAATTPIVQNFQTLLQDNRFVQQAFVQQNAFINQNIRGQMPGSSNDPPRPPAVPPTLAVDDRKREEVVKPIKKPKSSQKPKVPEARKIAPPLAIEDKSRDQTGPSKKPKRPEIKDIPIQPKAPKTRKVAIQILSAPTKKKPTNNELKQATKDAVQRILSNRPSRSKAQVITTNVDGLKKEIEDILEQTAKRRTGMSIKDMEVRRGVRA